MGNKEANVEKALRMIDEAAMMGAKLILLPELFNTEYICFRRTGSEYSSGVVFSYSETIPGPTTTRIAETAKKHGIYVIAPIFERAAPGIYYDSAPLMNPQGVVVAKYRKTHIPAAELSSEKLYFRPGSEFPVFKTKFGTLGVLICYDKNFPEAWRILTLKGAEVIFVPTAMYLPPRGQDDVGWEMMLRTRAYENGVFVVGVDRVGREEDVEFFGKSMIIDPWGKVLAKARREDAIISATIDVDDVDKARIEMPILRDLRPEIYGDVVCPWCQRSRWEMFINTTDANVRSRRSVYEGSLPGNTQDCGSCRRNRSCEDD